MMMIVAAGIVNTSVVLIMVAIAAHALRCTQTVPITLVDNHVYIAVQRRDLGPWELDPASGVWRERGQRVQFRALGLRLLGGPLAFYLGA